MNPKKPCNVYWYFPDNIEKARVLTSICIKSIKHLVNDHCFIFLSMKHVGALQEGLFKRVHCGQALPLGEFLIPLFTTSKII